MSARKMYGIVSLLMLTPACDAPEGDAAGAEEFLVTPAADELAAEPAEDEGEAILAEVEVEGGASVLFLDGGVVEGERGVAMFAIGAPGFAAAVHELEMTPLEVFLALAPGSDAPEELREQHAAAAERQGRASPEPRAFHVQGGAFVPIGDFTAPVRPIFNVYELFAIPNCRYGDLTTDPTWADAYCYNIAGGHDACDSGVTSGTQWLYTGAATENFLGACTASTTLTFRVEKEQSAGFWVLVTEKTIPVDRAGEFANEGTLMLDYRAKITPSSATASYQWGAARQTP